MTRATATETTTTESRFGPGAMKVKILTLNVNEYTTPGLSWELCVPDPMALLDGFIDSLLYFASPTNSSKDL